MNDFLILAGIFASLGQFGVTLAYKYAPAKEISIFDYSNIIFSAILSIFLFGVKACYAIVGAINPMSVIKLSSISITYMGFIILIGGLFLELVNEHFLSAFLKTTYPFILRARFLVKL